MNSAQEFLLKVGIHDKVVGNAKRTEAGMVIVDDTSMTYLSDMMEYWAKRKNKELEAEKEELIANLEFISEQEDSQYIKDILNKFKEDV